MGVFSKLHRFREAGEDANVHNVADFGEPVHSLFTSTKVFTLHHHIDIVDADERVVYQADSKAFSLHDKTEITDVNGNSVAYIERKLFSLHQKHFVSMADGREFELSSELLHIVKDIINVNGLGWQIRGNFIGLNFQIYDSNDNVIAVIGQKMFSIHDKYCIDIYRAEQEQAVVALLVTLQHMIRDREAASSASSSSSGS